MYYNQMKADKQHNQHPTIAEGMSQIARKVCSCGSIITLYARRIDDRTRQYQIDGAVNYDWSNRALCTCFKVHNFTRQVNRFENPTRDDLEKEIRRLQRELNGDRLGTYLLGDTSEAEQNRQKERAAKLARFHEILNTLNGVNQ